MLQPPDMYEDQDIQIMPTLILQNGVRHPGVVRDLAERGELGPELGRTIRALVPQGDAHPHPFEHEMRCLHGDGNWYAIYIVCRQGIQKMAILTFRRNGVIGPEEKAEIWRILGLAEKLVRELLEEQLRFAKEEDDAQ